MALFYFPMKGQTVDNNIIVLSAAATTFAKVAVDLARMGKPDLPRWLLPLLAIAAAIGALLLLMVAEGQIITPQLGAQAVLAGILAAASAVGVTELQKHANPAEAVRFLDTGLIGTARPDEPSQRAEQAAPQNVQAQNVNPTEDRG